MVVHQSRDFPIAYVQLPFRRNQDIIGVRQGSGGLCYSACVVDGFNFRDKVPGNLTGRKAAELTAETFPQVFLDTHATDIQVRADTAAKAFDRIFLKHFPVHVACVGSFIFEYQDEYIVIAIGTINTLIWNGNRWEKPQEIGNYFLPYPKYYSGSRTFFGLGEMKHNHFYSAKTDVLIRPAVTPLFIATDGLDDVINLAALNRFTSKNSFHDPKQYLASLCKEIRKINLQKDDISLLLRG